MSYTQDLIQHVIDKDPVAFGDTFNSALEERISQKIAERKLELSQSLFKDQGEASDD